MQLFTETERAIRRRVRGARLNALDISVSASLLKRALCIFGTCLLSTTVAEAQDVQPRIYTPAPVGVNLITVGYAFSSGAVLFDKTIPVENASANIHSLAVAYSRSVGVSGMAGRIDVALPFVVSGEWEGDVGQGRQYTSRPGIGDPQIRFSLFFVGAPALTELQFAGFESKTVVGGTLRVGLPLGQYDAERFVNLGSNRWVVSPQVGMSHRTGRIVLEGTVGAWFFAENSEFLGSNTLSQDPLFTFQVHVTYRFRKGLWLAASSRQSLGGATMTNENDRLAPESNNRVGLTLAVPIGPAYAAKLLVTTGLTASVGNDYTTLGASWQVVF